MRDKDQRDAYRKTGIIFKKELMELIILADERDDLETKLTAERAMSEGLRVEIKNLAAKLAEAHELFTLNVNELNAQICAKDRELERLRKAVPGDVEKAINRYFQSAIYGAQFGDYSRSQADENALLAIIGALVETNKEKLQGMLEEAYLKGSGYLYDWPAVREAAKAYANKIIGGEGDGEN
jgi:hypothetical protein